MSRKNNQNKGARQRNLEMMNKLQRSQKAVEDFMKDRDHQFMLR